jgi:uncharacterized protein (DUF924 family)
MAVKLLSESMDATITDVDQARIDAVIDFWFQNRTLTAPQIDSRMEIWFSEDPAFDHEIEKTFAADVDLASDGKLDHWAHKPQGLLALILLLDQFRRNIYRGTADAFAKDKAALKLCVEGAMAKRDQELSPIERVFFYMPLQHSESRKVQDKAVKIYERLAEAVVPTHTETFATIAQFAELHRDIIELFGRFPHRNKLLDRENTPQEDEYLAGENPSFGQGS